ncbi:ALP1-like protein isoform X1 [Tanacetum coccineum]
MSLSVIMKCTTAIRQLAYGNTLDAFDEYLQMSEHTARNCLLHFNKYIIDLYTSKCLRKPTLEDVEKLYTKHENVYGFLGMLGSIDCMRWEWRNCLIWHAFFEVAGANNDINVLDNSPLFDDLLDDIAPIAPFVVNGVGFEKGYYLADGIYPHARKDVERAFGVLPGNWGIIQQPARQYHVNIIRRIMYSCIKMHNMILEDQHMTVTNWNDVYANPSRNMQRTWVERSEVQRRKTKELRDIKMHISLQQNFMEHIWQEVKDEDEDF